MGYRFSKESRFINCHNNSPSPDQYIRPNTKLESNSVLRKSAQAVIGKHTYDIMDHIAILKEKKQIPGPGAYKHYSEFNNQLLP